MYEWKEIVEAGRFENYHCSFSDEYTRLAQVFPAVSDFFGSYQFLLFRTSEFEISISFEKEILSRIWIHPIHNTKDSFFNRFF